MSEILSIAKAAAKKQKDRNPNRLPPLPPDAERRRQHVLKMLADNPERERAVLCEDDTTDPVVVTVAVRGKGTLEVLIPKARYDGFALIELATTGKRPELAVIDGGRASGSESNPATSAKTLDPEPEAA